MHKLQIQKALIPEAVSFKVKAVPLQEEIDPDRGYGLSLYFNTTILQFLLPYTMIGKDPP